jgi:hypothetical protein
MQPGVVQFEPIGLDVDRFLAAQQGHDGTKGLVHPRPLRVRIDTHHIRVRRQRARPAAQHRAAARHGFQLHETLRNDEGMVIR